MKRKLPRSHELVLFAALALSCTLVLSITGKYDTGLALLGPLVFVVAALMGFARSGQLAVATIDEPDDDPVT
jgi:hypothetical protein